jgi:predicted ATP-grasp superfamily ATP-dependent carboligase
MFFRSTKRPTEKGLLLVVGLDATALAVSAYDAGYRTHVVDFFGDLEIRSVAEKSLSLIRQIPFQSCGRVSEFFSAELMLELVQKMSKDYSYDGILLSSGLEDSPEVLGELNDIAPILGNTPEAIANVRNRRHFLEMLGRHGVLHPRTRYVSSPAEATAAAKELGYPVVVKSKVGFGGANVRLIGNEKELAGCANGTVLVQEYVKGVAASASLLATQGRSMTLTINQQLLGLSSLGSSETFGYCGNLVPIELHEIVISECKKVSESVVEVFGLEGSNGIDFVIDDSGKPWVIEVNPRFQGTLECVEGILDINLVEAHLNACMNHRLPILRKTHGYCVRLVLYGRERSKIPDLRLFPAVRDTPVPNVIVEKGEPICSIVMKGDSAAPTILRGFEAAEAVYSSLHQCKG